MGADQRRGNAGPDGERVGVDKNFVPGGIDGGDSEQGAILFSRETGDDGCGERGRTKRSVRGWGARMGSQRGFFESLSAPRRGSTKSRPAVWRTSNKKGGSPKVPPQHQECCSSLYRLAPATAKQTQAHERAAEKR
jgi:hypothetical protein